ncbi:MAG: alkaline phosphatase D family protein [Bacteroidota bacterium]
MRYTSLLYVFTFTLVFSACNRQVNPTISLDTKLYQGQEIDPNQLLETIALGSCNRQDSKQDMWEYILENDPQLWIWLGDNIYGDSEDMEVMKSKYLQQKYGEEYSKLRKQMPVVGTWDDHDFGANNAGKEFPKRDESQALMLDFLDVAPDAPVRNQKGGYQAFTFGPKGKQVKVILLDSRYHRDAPISNRDGSGYLPNKTGTILGEVQWKWLENELRNSEAQVHLIGNGIQVIPQDHRFEKWFNFPKEREKLFNLLAKYQVANSILLSGDRHIAEISKLSVEGMNEPIYELTSSGMTHSYEKAGDEPNRHRVSKLIGKRNFGVIKIDWEANPIKIDLEVRGLKNAVHTSVQVKE